MTAVPWSYVSSWSCIACGECCRRYNVVLNYNEWVNIVRRFGVGVTRPSPYKFLLRRRSDGSCVFLYRVMGHWVCGLQDMKPQACKLWPFKVYSYPKYGRPNEAVYPYLGRKFYVYVDPFCRGIRWGTPTPTYMYRVIPEFIDIALGRREKQYYSTSRLVSPQLKAYLRLMRLGGR